MKSDSTPKLFQTIIQKRDAKKTSKKYDFKNAEKKAQSLQTT